MRLPLILIGPASAGKSTLGRLLAERLNLPGVSLDDARRNYYAEIGYDQQLADEIRQKGGFMALAFYWKLFEAHAVERIVADYPNAVIDFGAGSSVYENRVDFARVQKALSPHTVVLILPSPDPAESIRILHERTRHLVGTFAQGFDWHQYFVRHPSNYQLATHTVYTQGKTPEETVGEILALIGS